MNIILDEARLTFTSDMFGTVQGWRFALCDYLLEEFGHNAPGFRQSPFGPDVDAFEYESLALLGPTEDDCLYALKILDRAREIIRVEGLDY